MFFLHPLQEGIFGGSRFQPVRNHVILEQFSIPRGPQKQPLDWQFRPKSIQKPSTPNSGERPGADMGATCDPKRPKGTFSSIWDRLGVDLGAILYDFSWIFDRFMFKLLANCEHRHFSIVFRTSLTTLTQHHKRFPWNRGRETARSLQFSKHL